MVGLLFLIYFFVLRCPCVLTASSPFMQFSNDKHLKVNISATIQDVIYINEQSYELGFRFLFSMSWNESRIRNTTSNEELDFNSLFVPDLYIANLVEHKTLEVFEKKSQSIRLLSNGKIRFTNEGIVKLACKMDFKLYPLDTQICPLTLTSNSLTKDVLTLSGTLQHNTLGQRTSVYKISMTQTKQIVLTNFSNFSGISSDIILKRKVASFIVQTYMPTTLFVLSSWISFNLPFNCGERVGLVITVQLVMVSVFISIVSTTPNGSAPTAIEIWLIACILFCFFPLVEHSLIIIFARRKAAKELKAQKRSHKCVVEDAIDIFGNPTPEVKRLASKLDKLSFNFSILLFFIFNTLYWSIIFASM